MSIAELEVKHGYTVHDLEQMTRVAVIADRSMAMDYADRRDIAWSAIAEALCAAPHWPKRSELIQAGWQAIYRATEEDYRHHGYANRAQKSGYASAPRFVKFWSSISIGEAPWEERIVERIAVEQVIATLTPIYLEAITALATYGDYQDAADSLGISYEAFAARISVARRQTRGWWFEGETPRQVRRRDRRVAVRGKPPATHCKKGIHEWTPENTRIRAVIVRGKPREERVCRACERDRAVERRERAA